MSWFMQFLKNSKTSDLEKENLELKEELKNCAEKLIEKQEHINKTNAYWKKKFHAKTKKQSKL